MSHVYLEDLEDAIETTIWFQLFVKFKEKSMIFKTKYNAKLPRLHVTRTAQQKQPVKTPKQWAKVPKKEVEKPEQDGQIRIAC